MTFETALLRSKQRVSLRYTWQKSLSYAPTIHTRFAISKGMAHQKESDPKNPREKSQPLHWTSGFEYRCGINLSVNQAAPCHPSAPISIFFSRRTSLVAIAPFIAP